MIELKPTEWTRLRQLVFRFIHTRTRDSNLSDDLTQEVMIKAQKHLPMLKDAGKLGHWLIVMARNLVTDTYRSRIRAAGIQPMNEEAREENFNACVSGYLKKLIPELPDTYRTAVQLAHDRELPQQEIARFLGLSLSGAKSRVQRGRMLLRRKLEEDLMLQTDSYGNVVVCESRKPTCCRHH